MTGRDARYLAPPPNRVKVWILYKYGRQSVAQIAVTLHLSQAYVLKLVHEQLKEEKKKEEKL